MQAQQSFDSEQKIELLPQARAIVLDEAAWTFILHDLNPRAMSPKVKGLPDYRLSSAMKIECKPGTCGCFCGFD
jgi:ABC-type transport system substrate-binding protein